MRMRYIPLGDWMQIGILAVCLIAQCILGIMARVHKKK